MRWRGRKGRQGCDGGQRETTQSRGERKTQRERDEERQRERGGEKKMEYKDQWPGVCD